MKVPRIFFRSRNNFFFLPRLIVGFLRVRNFVFLFLNSKREYFWRIVSEDKSRDEIFFKEYLYIYIGESKLVRKSGYEILFNEFLLNF